MKKKYALVNLSTGEVYTIEGENITCQTLYRRALSCRRLAVYTETAQDDIKLFRINGYGWESLTNGSLIAEWKGGINTPIKEMGFCVTAYYSLKRRGCKTALDVASYICSTTIFLRIPKKAILNIEKVMRAYDQEATRLFRVNINKRRNALV